MSKLSKVLKKVILWLLGNGSIEYILEIAREIVASLESNDDLDSDEKRKQAFREIRAKLKELGKGFSSQMIYLAIELALSAIREKMD
jgi:hypothetical protein